MIKRESPPKERRIFWASFHTAVIILIVIGWYQEFQYGKSIQALVSKDGLRVSTCTHNNSPGKYLHTSQFTIQTIEEISYSPIKIRLEFNNLVEEAHVATFSYSGINSNLLSFMLADNKKEMTIIITQIGLHASSPLVVDVFSNAEIYPTRIEFIKN